MSDPDLVALLCAAKDIPTTILPRLILADWLEEQGIFQDTQRAKLIRAQCDWKSQKGQLALETHTE